MFRKCSSGLLRQLIVSAALIAGVLACASPSMAAAACQPKAAEPCAQQSADGWKPEVVEVRERKAQLEAIRFAERVKRHLGREFAQRKLQFVKHQARLERQRRAHKRRAKAHQFAAARRHAAAHVHRLRPEAKGHMRRFVHNKPQRRAINGGNARHALRWRSLWRHNAQNDVPQQRAN